MDDDPGQAGCALSGRLHAAELRRGLFHRHFDLNLWWVDLRSLPAPWRVALLTATGVLLIAYAVRPEMKAWRRAATCVVLAGLTCAAAWNVADYHLPRIKMCYQRAGVEVFTVPAKESRLLRDRGFYMMAREIAAVWAYYLGA
jgi:hypothetical protein